MAAGLSAAPRRGFTDEPWADRPKRRLQARLVSSEFNVGFRTNELGLRGPSLASGAGPRLLGLGDSFAMGFGVEEEATYLSVLARSLGQRGQAMAPVNAGVVGYNLRSSYAYLVGQGLSFRPAVVLLQVWVGDDLPADAASCRPAEQGKGDGSLRLKESVRYSRVAMLLRDRLRQVDARRAWLLQRGWLQRSSVEDLLRPDLEERWGPGGVQATADLLGRRRDLCRDRGARFVVLLVPLKEQVYESAWQAALAYNGVHPGPAEVDRDAPNRIVRRLAAAAGVELVDVLDQFRAQAQGPALYFAVDPHLTAAGHRLVAEALAEHLGGAAPAGGGQAQGRSAAR